MDTATPRETDPFVGRAEALADLEQAADRAATGLGGVWYVAGEPGIGKTRLFEELASRATASGWRVTWATCWEGDGAPAFWPWVQVVRKCVEGLDPDGLVQRLGPRVGDAVQLATATAGDRGPSDDPGQVRFRLFDSVAALLAGVAATEPLLVVLDDLHWADVPSLRLLQFLSGELHSSRVFVVGAFRDVEVGIDEEAGRVLGDLVARAGVVELPGLGDDEVADLMAATSGSRPDPDAVREIHRRSGGNPLFVAELARLIEARAAGTTPGGPGSIPASVRAVIERRLVHLHQACSDLLGVAAVLGQDFDLELLEAVSRTSRGEALDLLDEAARAGLLVPADETGTAYAFSHALVRDVLYVGLPTRQRLALHHAAGEALEAGGAADDDRVAEVAHHFLRSAAIGDAKKAVTFAERAGRQSLRMLAYEEAAGHFRRALEAGDLADLTAEHRCDLLVALGEAVLAAGDLPGARTAFEEAVRIARESGLSEALARAALGFGAGLSGFEVQLFDEAQVTMLEEALRVLPDQDSELRARSLARLSVAQSFVESDERRRALTVEAVAMARRLGDPLVLSQALASYCDAIAGPDRVDERMEVTSEIVDLAVAGGDPATELLGRRMRLVALLERGDFTAAAAEIDAYERTAAALDQPLYSWYVPLWRGFQELVSGRFERCLGFSDEAEAMGARAQSFNADVLTKVQRYGVAYQRGEHERAAEMITSAIVDLAEIGPQAELLPAASRAVAGDLSAWWRLDHLELLDAAPFDAEWLSALCILTDAAIAASDEHVAAGLYDRLAPYGGVFAIDGIGAGCWGCADHYLGRLAVFLGRRDDARRHLERAVELHRRSGATFFLAGSLAELGDLLGDGDRLREARELYAGMGLLEGAGPAPSGPGPVSARGGENVFRSEGDVWVLAYGGDRAQLRDLKGLHDLSTLLAAPGRDLAAVDLAGVGATTDDAEGLHPPGDAGELLDARARREYEARIRDLDDDLEEAEAAHDVERAAKARAERDAILDELAAAVGLGGRPRRAGDPAERARTAVTWRIRSAIDRIDDVLPALGRHLRKSVRTGTFCSYDPEEPPTWQL